MPHTIAANARFVHPAGHALWSRYLNARYDNLYRPFDLDRSVTTSELDHPPERPGVLHRMLMLDNEVAAVARLDIQPKHADGPRAQLRYFAVNQPFRGSGAGTMLLTRLECEARAHGCEVLWMEARTRAIGFYSRAGYADVGEGPTKYGLIPHRIMLRRL